MAIDARTVRTVRAARAACLDCALAANERFGVWGATLPDERRAMQVHTAA